MAGGTIAELNVAINAVDNASGVIAGIAAELGGLSGTAVSAASGVGNVNGVLNDTARAGRTANAAYTAAARGGNMLVRTSEDLQRSGVIIKQYGEGVDTLTKPLQTAAVVALGLGTASTVAAVKFEDNFANVKKTVEGTPEQLEAVRKGIIDMTTVGINGHGAIPQTTAELTELAAAGGQLGIQTENILDFTETMAMLGSATNLQGEAGAQTLARFMNVANVSQKDIGRLGSAIVDLGNNFATTEAEIANMAMDMGATGATVGMSAQDILGYATAMSSMGIEAAAGGSALQRIWMDMQNSVSKGGDRLEAFAKVSGKSSKEFQKQWKEDATGAFNDFLKGLNNSPDQVGLLNALDFNNVRDQRALLALAGEKGFDILTEAIKRSNKAWEENTALQTEFENKQQTTASQIQIAKNNAVEAARSFGEVLLPTVVNVTGGLSGAARGLASLDDNSKKALVTTGAFVIGLGAVSKGTVGVIKGIGNTADALGKIKKAKEAGGVLANIATVLPTVATAATPVAAGIATVTAAVVASKKAYSHYYDTKYNFAKGLSEENEKLQESYKSWKQLNDLQWEYGDLTSKVNSGTLAGDELEKVKSRIEEIRGILQNEFKINVDSSGIDDALLKVKEIDFYENKNQLQRDYDNKKPAYDKAVEELPKLQAEYDAASGKAKIYDDALSNILKSQDKFNNGVISASEYTNEYTKILQDLGKETGKDFFNQIWDANNGIDTPDMFYGIAKTWIDKYKDELNLDTLNKKINDYTENIQLLKDAAKGLADVNLSQFEDAFQSGADTDQYVNGIKKFTEAGKLSADEYAKKLSLITSGQQSLQEVWEEAWQGNGQALDSYVNNYIGYAQKLGSSTEQVVEGAALIKEGFKNVSEVGDNAESIQAVLSSLLQLGNQQGLTMTADLFTQMAHEMKLIPEEKKVTFTSSGAPQVVEDAEKTKEAVDEATPTELAAKDVKQPMNLVVALVQDGADLLSGLGSLVGESLGGTTASAAELPEKEAKQKFSVKTEFEEKTGSERGKFFDDFLKDKPQEQKTITQDVTVTAGSIDTSALVDTMSSAMELVGSSNETEITRTVNITAVPGSIDTSALADTMSSAMELVGAANESSITRTVNITAVPGSVDTSALSGAVEGAVSGLSSASVTTDIAVNGTADFALGTSPTSVPPATGVANFVLGSYPTEIPPITATVNVVYSHKAQGTQYFGGGLAMVNDELGRADKSELIIDQGRAFIPQGENVVLPLSKGAKVYTATQTQRILKSLGIAQYAGGKDNDDILGTLQSLGLNGIKVQKAMPDNVRTNAEWLYEWKNGGSMAGAPNSKDFELAKEKFEHEKKTRAMSTTEELQKWIEFSKQFNETEKDIAVIEEQIFSLTSKISDELNKQSSAWIEDRVALNDWQGYGDSAIAAFDRVKERNYKDFQDGLITWQEYTDTISDLGSDMYSGRIKHSKAWLEHEENYNDMSTDGYLAGIDRMRQYTEEYYAKGLINHREYVEGKIELDEMEADKKREQYEEWKNDADAWETMRDTYGDWGESGNENNKEEFLINKIKRVQEALAAGKLDRETFTADMNQYKMDVFKYREEMYDDFLSQRKDYISDLKDEFVAAEKELQDSWTVEDRKADMSEVSEQLYIYSDAVTDRGQQKYKELQEQMKQLQRDEELYQLQVANNETIEALEEEYKQLEADKSVFLKGIKDNFDIDVSGLLSGFEQSNNTINRTLGDIINAINNIKMEQTIYSDSRKIQNNISHVTGELYDEIIVSVSGR